MCHLLHFGFLKVVSKTLNKQNMIFFVYLTLKKYTYFILIPIHSLQTCKMCKNFRTLWNMFDVSTVLRFLICASLATLPSLQINCHCIILML